MRRPTMQFQTGPTETAQEDGKKLEIVDLESREIVI